jgi:hypothetical protein
MRSPDFTHRLARAALAVLVAAGGGCGEEPPAGPAPFSVSYAVSGVGAITIDSVKYDDGGGTLIKVTAPPADWVVRLTVPAGGSVQAQAWGLATSPASAKLKVVWSRGGVDPGADSSFTSTSGPGGVLLVIPPRQL